LSLRYDRTFEIKTLDHTCEEVSHGNWSLRNPTVVDLRPGSGADADVARESAHIMSIGVEEMIWSELERK
jgi:hypothetical protein